MTLTLYGLKNCDTVQKARRWLDAADIGHAFHDYKVTVPDALRLAAWINALGCEAVLNRSGTTFRKLPDAEKANLDAGRALPLMLALPSLIRRPILDGMVDGKSVLVAGFKPDIYAALLQRARPETQDRQG